jgi:hypothetical protein
LQKLIFFAKVKMFAKVNRHELHDRHKLSSDMSAKAGNSETVRARGRGGRRFVVPRPGTTLSHLVII